MDLLPHIEREFRPYLDRDHPDYANKGAITEPIGQILLMMPGFEEFVAEFFSGDFVDRLHKELWKWPKPENGSLKAGVFRRFSGEKTTRGVEDPNVQDRWTLDPTQKHVSALGLSYFAPASPVAQSDTYRLTKDETATAIEYIANHPTLEQSVAAYKACIKAYFKEFYMKIPLFYSLLSREGKSPAASIPKNIDRFYLSLRDNAEDFSLSHDFLPIIAWRLAQDDGCFDTQMHRAMHELFGRQAFHSYSPGRLEFTKCPFAQTLMRHMSMRIEKDTDGQCIVSAGHPPGEFLLSAMTLIEQRGQTVGSTVPFPTAGEP